MFSVVFRSFLGTPTLIAQVVASLNPLTCFRVSVSYNRSLSLFVHTRGAHRVMHLENPGPPRTPLSLSSRLLEHINIAKAAFGIGASHDPSYQVYSGGRFVIGQSCVVCVDDSLALAFRLLYSRAGP